MENEIQPNVPSHTNWQKVLLFIFLGLVVIAVVLGVFVPRTQLFGD